MSQFPGSAHELSYIAENGALVKAKDRLIFSADISRDAVLTTLNYAKSILKLKT